MKKILSGFIVGILSLTLGGCGQPRVPSEQLVYSEVVKHKEKADDAYELSKMWLAQAFNDSKAVLEYSNKKNHTIMGKGILTQVHYGTIVFMDTRFTIKIETKDNKSKITLSDMVQKSSFKDVRDFKMWNIESLNYFITRAKPMIAEYAKYMNKTETAAKSDW